MHACFVCWVANLKQNRELSRLRIGGAPVERHHPRESHRRLGNAATFTWVP
jgi:hypothetical protein